MKRHTTTRKLAMAGSNDVINMVKEVVTCCLLRHSTSAAITCMTSFSKQGVLYKCILCLNSFIWIVSNFDSINVHNSEY